MMNQVQQNFLLCFLLRVSSCTYHSRALISLLLLLSLYLSLSLLLFPSLLPSFGFGSSRHRCVPTVFLTKGHQIIYMNLQCPCLPFIYKWIYIFVASFPTTQQYTVLAGNSQFFGLAHFHTVRMFSQIFRYIFNGHYSIEIPFKQTSVVSLKCGTACNRRALCEYTLFFLTSCHVTHHSTVVLVCLLGLVEFLAYSFCSGFLLFVTCAKSGTKLQQNRFLSLNISTTALQCRLPKKIKTLYWADLVMPREEQHNIKYRGIDYIVFQSIWRVLHVKEMLFIWVVCVRINVSRDVAEECAWQCPVDMTKYSHASQREWQKKAS